MRKPPRQGVIAGRDSVEAVVGARPGPRVALVGDGDALALAVARRVAASLATDALAGEVVLGWRGFVGEAALRVELGGGTPGLVTVPHLRVDPAWPRSLRLARAFGTGVVVENPGAGAVLRLEAGEPGRAEPAVVAWAAAGFVAVLRALRMLPPAPRPPGGQLLVEEVVSLRARHAGTLVPLVTPGTPVAAGAPLAMICDARGDPRAPLTFARPGVLLATPTSPTVAARGVALHVGAIRALIGHGVPGIAPAAVGWCEWVGLPDLGLPRLHAKIDTGARTSALHVAHIRTVGEEDGRALLEVRLTGDDQPVRVLAEEELVVRDSGGHLERRPVIETTLELGALVRRVRVTLTHRGDMQFPMLIGRTALGDCVVDVAGRHLQGRPVRRG